jgi:hypothetical protein
MREYITSFATPNFYQAQERLHYTSIGFGILPMFWVMDMLKTTEFYKNNKELLDSKKGAGYWAWKPFIILKVLESIDYGDALFYCDSGINLIRNPRELIPLCKKEGGILLFSNDVQSFKYTKRDCFVEMKADYKRYWHSYQAFGGFQVYIKTKKTVEFIKEWLNWVQIPHLVDDSMSIKPNFKGFIQHSWDQSILSILAQKHNINLHRRIDTTDSYNIKYPKDKYPVYLIVDRLQNRTFIQKQILNFKMMLPLSVKHKFKSLVNKNGALHNMYYGK